MNCAPRKSRLLTTSGAVSALLVAVMIFGVGPQSAYPQTATPRHQLAETAQAVQGPTLRSVPTDWRSVLADATRRAAELQQLVPTKESARRIQAELRAVERTLARAEGVAPTDRKGLSSLHRDIQTHRANISTEMKRLERQMEELRNTKQMATNKFQRIDQIVKETLQGLARTLRTLGQVRTGVGIAKPGM